MREQPCGECWVCEGESGEKIKRILLQWSFLVLLPVMMDGLGGGRKSIYLKMAIKKICLSRGKMAVWALAVDVSDEARLIHLQTDTAALMWLKIADLTACDRTTVESASSPVGL